MYNVADLRQVGLVPVSQVTSTGGTTAVQLTGEPEGTLMFAFDVAAGSGTTPSYTPAVQSSPDGSTWTTLATGTAVTSVAGQQKLSVDSKSLTGLYLRVLETLAGTTPGFYRSVQLIYRDRIFP